MFHYNLYNVNYFIAPDNQWGRIGAACCGMLYTCALYHCCRRFYRQTYPIYLYTSDYLTNCCAIVDALREALPYLLSAESDFCKLEMYQSAKDVQYLLSVLYHNLDMKDERQNAAQRHSDTELKQHELEMAVLDKEVLRVFELIATVGDALASR